RVHRCLSKFRGRRCADVVVNLITMGGFFRDAPKAENGFVFVRIVSSRSARRHIWRKTPIISDGSRRCSKRSGKLRSGSEPCCPEHGHIRAFHSSYAFYVFLLKRPERG